MYKNLLRPIFFCFDAEKIHDLTFLIIKIFSKIPFLFSFINTFYKVNHPKLETNLFGIKFPNPVGLAAGLDKNAKLINQFSSLGFGFIEIGTVTPLAQKGNSKKRLFRLANDQGIINRMGFNNDGVDTVLKRLKCRNNVIVGGNIGKNKSTDNKDAVSDYLICFEKLFPYVNYFAINVSSPNTENLRDLQHKDNLHLLLKAIQKKNSTYPEPKPILLKIAPDLSSDQLLDIIDVVKTTSIDGVIATNTTLSREGLKSPDDLINQKGGLSGRPLCDKSTQVIKFLHEKSNGSFPIIGVGGIMNSEDALDKIKAGASLIQLYTGFVYSGPGLVKQINQSILSYRLNQ
ncbi:MAG: quinone-dependent dihydroorotate dehydrogenase [Bacteroidetes bacterium]|nr:quinone-dependent dihydroorotate dehydrogenase [Bacteroidota bacterium]MDA1019768.1 quinone-dependent dihydroorotate dehydrogenase [Bacteroidota bacterium]